MVTKVGHLSRTRRYQLEVEAYSQCERQCNDVIEFSDLQYLSLTEQEFPIRRILLLPSKQSVGEGSYVIMKLITGLQDATLICLRRCLNRGRKIYSPSVSTSVKTCL